MITSLLAQPLYIENGHALSLTFKVGLGRPTEFRMLGGEAIFAVRYRPNFFRLESDDSFNTVGQ